MSNDSGINAPGWEKYKAENDAFRANYLAAHPEITPEQYEEKAAAGRKFMLDFADNEGGWEKAAAYWFRKLEGIREPCVWGDDWHLLEEYLAARHGLTPNQFKHLALSDVAEMLQRDYEKQRQGDRAGALAVVPGDPAASQRETTQPKKRMRVAEANEEAMKLARKMRAGFFALSGRQQAGIIGCAWGTWRKTKFYQKAQEKKPAGKRRKLPSPKTESLTTGRETVTGEGEKDEVLKQLILEQEADEEPSPLENDPPDRRRKIHFRKRL